MKVQVGWRLDSWKNPWWVTIGKWSVDLLVWTRFPNSFHRSSFTLDLQVAGNHFYMRYNTPTNVIMISYDCTAGEIWEVEQKGHLKNQLRHEKKWALLSIDLDTLSDHFFFHCSIVIQAAETKRQETPCPVCPCDALWCEVLSSTADLAKTFLGFVCIDQNSYSTKWLKVKFIMGSIAHKK